MEHFCVGIRRTLGGDICHYCGINFMFNLAYALPKISSTILLYQEGQKHGTIVSTGYEIEKMKTSLGIIGRKVRIMMRTLSPNTSQELPIESYANATYVILFKPRLKIYSNR